VARRSGRTPPKRRIQAAYRSGSLERVQPVLDRLQAAAASRPAPLVLAHVG
jgi:hypothetical protein